MMGQRTIRWRPVTGLTAMLLLLGGCAGPGGDQNYRELERDPVWFEREPMGDAEAPAPEAAEAPAPDAAEAVVEAPPPLPPVLAGPAVEILAPAMDRSDWPTVVFTPAEARVTHWPTYFNVPQGEDYVDVLEPEDVETRLILALKQPAAAGYGQTNVGNLFLEPALFAANVALLPVQLVVQPPWTTVTAEGTN